MAISDVLLEQISQITNIMYLNNLSKSFTWWKICQKCCLKTLESTNYRTYIIICLKTKLDKGGSPLMWIYHRHNADNVPNLHNNQNAADDDKCINTQTCPGNIYCDSSRLYKLTKCIFFFLFLLKTLILGTR